MTEETTQEDQPLLLMVDDDPTFTRVMARALSRRGLQVETRDVTYACGAGAIGCACAGL